jgi:hypothetical protein
MFLGGGKDDAAAKMRERIVKRAALELKHGMNVNLGIGMPTLASNVSKNKLVLYMRVIFSIFFYIILNFFFFIYILHFVFLYLLIVFTSWYTNYVTK